jgi:hypothetical protein
MSNVKYYPFLKLKKNELLCLKDLEDNISASIIPFFDIAKPQVLSEASVQKSIDSGKKELFRHWNSENAFYIDSFDIPDSIEINEQHAYKYVLEELSEFNLIPVIGLNRHSHHRYHAEKFINDTGIAKIAIRLTPDDFSDFTLIEVDLNLLLEPFDKLEKHFIFDCRLILSEDNVNSLKRDMLAFIDELDIEYSKIIFTGSSISAKIGDHSQTNEQISIPRFEWKIFKAVKKIHSAINYGDYSIISPNYSDANIAPELLRNLSTPKIFYSSKDETHIFRGSGFTASRRGQKQYFDLAKDLVAKKYYRGKEYSVGDNFIFEKSEEIGSPSSQGNWYRMLNNCHITYVCR